MTDAHKPGPRVVVVGAGSLFFGRQAIWQMVHSPHLQRGTLVLVDTDEERLAKLVRLAEMVRDANAVPLGVEGHTDWVPALPGADFVVLSFANQTVKYRGIDCAIAEKYGVRMCSGDTIGPGGIFRALREFPRILECAADVERLCPEAWVVNYINPSTVHGIGLMRYAPGIKSFALCDSLHMPHIKVRLAGMAGIEAAVGGELTGELDRDFDMRIAGVNHFTWLLRAEWQGADVSDAIADSLRAGAAYEDPTAEGEAKGWLNKTIGAELYDLFDRVPVCVSHTKEYVPYYQQASRSGNGTPPLAIWGHGDPVRPARGHVAANRRLPGRHDPDRGLHHPAGPRTMPRTSSRTWWAAWAGPSSSTAPTAARSPTWRTTPSWNCCATSTWTAPCRDRSARCRAACWASSS